jgi:hypothetical protein
MEKVYTTPHGYETTNHTDYLNQWLDMAQKLETEFNYQLVSFESEKLNKSGFLFKDVFGNRVRIGIDLAIKIEKLIDLVDDIQSTEE